jgi:RimJ/RimL family protein N-acetyltransferase
MLMPTPTLLGISLPRSEGPLPLPVAGAVSYDPVQIAWLDPARPDDLDPAGDDPLAPLAEDAALRRGLTLRPWLAGDRDAFRALLDDPHVWAHLPEPYPAPLEEAGAAALIRLANGFEGHIVRAVISEGAPVGQVRLDLAAAPGAAEISYWLGAAHWGRGIGSALVAGTAARVFARRTDLVRLTAKVHPENPASARVLEKAGFRPCPGPTDRFPGWRWFHLRRQDLRGGGMSSEASP